MMDGNNKKNRDAVKNVMKEVEMMQLLQKDGVNEHIIKFHDFWISFDKKLIQLYDYYAHGTLFEIVEHNQRFNYLQILEIMRQILDGLQHIHDLKIVHLDLKPSNIFFTEEYILKIGDFGISVNLNLNKNGDKSSTSSSSLEYDYSGDPIYIAPELLSFNRSLNNISCKTDIYSLGIILLELLCDIRAPSQGEIFQNLRRNKIDFDVMEPSPLKSKLRSKRTPKQQNGAKQLNQGFTFPLPVDNNDDNDQENDGNDQENDGNDQKNDSNDQKCDDDDDHDDENINYLFLSENDFKIMEEIDTEIKSLCVNMLQQNPDKRPNCNEARAKIHEILNNERYTNYFKNCKTIRSLKLTPSDVINAESLKKQNNNHRGSGFNSSNATSSSNSNNQSICNSDSKEMKQQEIKTENNNSKIELIFDDNSDDKWFIQPSSPMDHESMFEIEPISFLSPIDAGDGGNDDQEEEFQLNLNSAFDDTDDQDPFILSASKLDQDLDDDDDDTRNAEPAEEVVENTRGHNVGPKNLLSLFSF